MAESAGKAYLCYLHISLREKFSRLFEAIVVEAADRLFTDYIAETAETFALAYVCRYES